jgi:lipopolysaccharide transport system ATP-binding protein
MATSNLESATRNEDFLDHSSLRAPDSQLVLRLENVGKCYRRYARQLDRVKQWMLGGRRRWYQEYWALRNVNLTVERGQTIGVLGANGSGKSTLLQLIAGTLTPSEGTLGTKGRIAALLELGSGFHPEFTGWENARLQAGILGLTPEAVENRLPQIAAFCELGDALEQPLRTYSSGMIVRLGFSVAISVDPDILLIDEALAVGDIRFQQKCMMRIRQLREQGVTILLVTHDLSAIKRLCDQAHVLQCGNLVRSGPSDSISNWYFGRMTETGALSIDAETHRGNGSTRSYFRHGDGRAQIESWAFLDEEGKPTERMWLGNICRLRVRVRFRESVSYPVLGFYLRDRLGTEVLGTNTQAERVPLCAKPDRQIEVNFRFALRLRPGVYTLCVALADSSELASISYLDWIDNAQILEVLDPQPGRIVHGLVAEEYEVAVNS